MLKRISFTFSRGLSIKYLAIILYNFPLEKKLDSNSLANKLPRVVFPTPEGPSIVKR